MTARPSLFLAQAANGGGSKVSDRLSYSSPDTPPMEAATATSIGGTGKCADSGGSKGAGTDGDGSCYRREGGSCCPISPILFYFFRVFNQPVCARSSIPFICWIFESRQCSTIFMPSQPFQINRRRSTAVRVTPPKVDQGKGDHSADLKALLAQF